VRGLQISVNVPIHLSVCSQTVSSLMSFFVGILLRPDIQTMAQKQLDAVTWRERFPTFEDRPYLSIIDAICQEVLRWRATVPIGKLTRG